MHVWNVMHADVRWCTPGSTLAEAGRMMAEADCGLLPVVDDGRVVAVITDRDVCLALARRDRAPSSIAVREVMSREVHSCGVAEDLRAALARMRDKSVRRLPVLDDRRRLIGILTLDDVALAARAFDSGGFGGPLYPDVAQTLQAICLTQATPQGATFTAA